MTLAHYPIQRIRNVVCARAGYVCERCGANDGLRVMSRLMQPPERHTPVTLIQLCHCCREWLIEHPQQAIAEGWAVPNDADPVAVAVKPISLTGLALLGGRYRPLGSDSHLYARKAG